MTKPLTPKEYQDWKDTGLIDGDIIDRFAATLDFLFSANTILIEALKRSASKLHSLRDEPECLMHLLQNCPKSYCVEAYAVIKEAEEKKK